MSRSSYNVYLIVGDNKTKLQWVKIIEISLNTEFDREARPFYIPKIFERSLCSMKLNVW